MFRIVIGWTFFLVFASIAGAEQEKRPNILFAFADDWGRFASIYAQADGPGTLNDFVKTPNIDRLAREGVLFRKAFVSAPSCTPCRSALLSGQHFWRTGRGAILRGAVWDPAIPAYPLLLRDSGYHIGETYKVWGPGTPNDAPYGAGKHAFEKAGGKINQFSQSVTKALQEGVALADAKEQILRQVDANFNAFLNARPEGAPFCYWFGPTNVHRQWTQGSGKALWGFDPDQLEGKMPSFLPDVPIVREDLCDYFGEIAAFDAAVGRLIRRLEETGELDNTLIVISGDHGPPGFPHGKCNLYDFGTNVSLIMRWGQAPANRSIDDLVSLTDLAPTFLEAAGVPIPSTMTGRSLMGILQSSKSGKCEPARDAVFVGRERHVENARADFKPYPQRAIRTDDYLYILNFEPDRWPLGDPYRLEDGREPTLKELTDVTRVTLPDEDAGPTKAWLVQHRHDPEWRSHFEWVYGKRPQSELYDLNRDPNQTRNVAGDSDYAKVREQLHARLMQELERTGDPRVQNGGDYFESPPLSGPVRESDK
ncbi:Choline-sulfatase [Pirellula sp. SH-Sr6A]|uniref:sulfatase family protein n=1 Tax=Pirellula sp. SH-Sr6A TaxID=1632865 RepID=UPI00078CA30C|nr:sulfatase [Pirellula sp. SH-Sr6A]AMV32547.1 Choline-sulfatase [Pirellula sp. SH-Sr6A]